MKKLISLVVAIAMLMSLSAVALASGTTTVYCNAPSSWSKCNVYWWGSSQSNPGWPGEAMTKGADGIWYYNVPSDATNVIFNNGSGAQSADLVMPTDDKVQFNYTDKEWVTYGTAGEELTLITLYVDIEGAGLTSSVNAYMWDCVSANSWPGTAMTQVSGSIYAIEVYSDTVNVIFNDGTNQTADLTVPTDGKNLWNGTEWTTYSEEVAIPTYNLVTGVTQSISIPVGGSVNVVVDATTSDMVLTVNGNRNYYDWYVQAGMMPSYPGPSGAAESQLSAGTTYTIPIYNTSADTIQVLDVTAAAPAFGTMDNPAALVMGENVADADAMGYFFTWTATEDGELTIAVDTAVSSDWTFCINVYSDSTSYGDMHFSDDSPVDADETVTVKAGDSVEIIVGTASYGEATVVLNASFKAGTQSGGDDVIPGTSKENAIDITNSPWHYIEAGATVWFVYDDSMDALFGIYSQLLNIHSSTTYSVVYDGQNLSVDENGYVSCELASNDFSGKYYLAITNNGAEKAFFSISLEDKPAYVNTYEYLYLGENPITLDSSAEYTLWEFEPTETGVYLLSIPDANGLIGNWGSSWYPQDLTENKSNTLEWTCTSVGQSIMIGVSGVDSTVLTIELKGEYIPEEEIDWTIYENEELKADYVVDGELTAIDVTDDISDEVWVDEDGFVRYGSEYGPIVVADLSDCPINFAEAALNGQLRFYVYLEDVLIGKIDVNNAMMEYVDAGITPMTEELAFMLMMLGEKNGWYDPSIPGFYLWDGEDGEPAVIVNPEEAWLFPCYIVEGTEIDPEDDNGDNNDDNNDNEQVILSDYIVAGSSGLCGSEWDPADASNKMVDNGNGTYSITFKNVAVGTYEFKITKGSWAENWGVGGANGGNVTVNVETVGDVTITFVAATGEIIVNNEQIPPTNDNPSTNDNGMDAIMIIAVLSAMCVVAVICTKKKFF